MFRSKAIALAAAIALGASGLAGCTSTDLQATSAALSAACSAAVVGTTIYVNVESSLGGNTAQKISQVVNGSTSTACTTLTSAVAAAVQSITSAGGTATVTVETAAPTASHKRKLIAKAVVVKTVSGETKVTYTVAPPTGIEALLNSIGL